MNAPLTLDDALPADWHDVFTARPCSWPVEAATIREALDARLNNWTWIAQYSCDRHKSVLTDYFIAFLDDEGEHALVRQNAAYALGYIGDVRAVEPLFACLNDEGEHVLVRRSAAEALGKIADARAVEPLISRLRDEDARVRRSAAEALGKIGDARAVEPLTACLRDKDEHARVQQAAKRALERIQGASQ